MTTQKAPLTALGRAMRMALMATSATLALGLVLSLLVSGPAAPVAEALVWLGLAMLVAIPVLNVVDVLIVEWQMQERSFAAAAAIVLMLLAYSVVSKLSR